MTNKTYQYWVYYIKEEYVDEVPLVLNGDLIYAYTDNKDIASEFELYRDMNKFIKRKLELTRLEVNLLAKNEQTQILKIRECTTRDENGKLITTIIAMTAQEEKYLDMHVMTCLHNLMYKYMNIPIPCNIFDEKLFKYLSKIEFFSLSNNSLFDDLVYIKTDSIEIKNNSMKKVINTDELGIFIYIFKNILTGG